MLATRQSDDHLDDLNRRDRYTDDFNAKLQQSALLFGFSRLVSVFKVLYLLWEHLLRFLHSGVEEGRKMANCVDEEVQEDKTFIAFF